MIDALREACRRYDELAVRLSDPAVIGDGSVFPALMKEYTSLTPLCTKFREYEKALAEAESAALLQKEEDDPEMRLLAEEEEAECRALASSLEKELSVLLIPKDPNDDRNVIVEIRGGAGGDEAALFANSLYRMYSMYAESHGFRCEILNLNETELGGIKEISFLVSGTGAFSRFKFESGVHRVQRVPETESGGRIHTSTVTVAVLPEAEEVEVDINPADLQIDTYRASGAGGQHVNKTESAIRITHLPTGLVVECQDERSQYKNKDKAMKVLRSRLFEKEREKAEGAIASERRAQVGTGDRSERIRTYNFPQGRVSDHRIGLTLYKLEAFLNGDMDEMIDALHRAASSREAADGSAQKGTNEG